MLGISLISMVLLLNITTHLDSVEIRVELKDKRDICADRMNYASSNIAVKAAEEAKAAESAQYASGCQAAHKVKEQLAQKAMEAARAAQAATAIKSALVNEIMREKEAVKMVIMELMNSKSRTEKAIEGQLRALQGQKSVLKVLMAAAHVAQSTSSNADSVLRGIHYDLVEKERVLRSALHRTDILSRDEECARKEVAMIKFAVRKAVMAASEAKANAVRFKRMSITI